MFSFLSIIFLLCSPSSEIHACAHTQDPQSVCWREYFSRRSTKLEFLGMKPYSTFSHKHLRGGSSTLSLQTIAINSTNHWSKVMIPFFSFVPINWLQKQFPDSKNSQVKSYLVSIFEKKKPVPEKKGDLPRVKEEVNVQQQTLTFSLGLPITLTSFCWL